MARLGNGLELDGAVALRPIFHRQARRGRLHLVLMYVVFVAIGRPAGDPDAFSYMYVGNSFFIFVASVLFGTFQVIQSDRGWYQTIRYVYISPISYYVYILGPAAAKISVAAFALAITLVFGVFFLDV